MTTALKRILSRMGRMLFLGLVMGVFAFGFTYTSASAQESNKVLEPGKVTHLGTYRYSEQRFVLGEKSQPQQETAKQRYFLPFCRS